MGLAWIIFADPELVLGQGRLRKLDTVPCPGKLFCRLWVTVWASGIQLGVSGMVTE